MKKESYFKRVKKPIGSLEEAKPIVKETNIYLLANIAAFVVFFILGIVVPVVNWLFIILAIVALFGAAYFGFMRYAMSRALKRFKNMHCECGGAFVKDENTTWQEISRQWQNTTSNSKQAGAKLYVTVKFTWKCPKCGKVNTFNERLCSGTITVTNHSTRDTVVSTQSLVDDYFNGLIHT